MSIMVTSPTPSLKPVLPNPPMQLSDQDGMEFLSIGSSQFNVTGLTTLYNSTFAQGFSNDERQAAARALLRHNAHLDGAHYQSRIKGGLRPMYVGFNPSANNKKAQVLSNKELAEASLQDVFDTVSKSLLLITLAGQW